MLRPILLFISVAVLFAACTQAGPADQISAATSAYTNGEYDECNLICDKIMADSTAFNNLSVAQLCTLSELYVKLGEGVGENDASAARCLQRARDISADSVDAFIRSKSSEVAAYLTILDRVGTYMDMSRDSLLMIEEEPIDTILE